MIVEMPHWVTVLLPRLALFAVIWLPIAMVPGPSTAVVIRQTLRSGRRSAFAATMANQLGLLFWALVATFGLSSLVAASQVAYDAIRIVGAAVLVVFGLQSLLRARAKPREAAEATTPESGWKGFRVGLVTILGNPKAAAFVFALLPQFVPRGAPVLPSLLALSMVLVVVDTAWYVMLAWMVNLARRTLTRPRVRQRLEQVSGLVMVGFGIRIAAERL
jgi:threonine/homoserine/homoserine lactone efflux protein